jgi:hypothetical protein
MCVVDRDGVTHTIDGSKNCFIYLTNNEFIFTITGPHTTVINYLKGEENTPYEDFLKILHIPILVKSARNI